MGLFTKLPDLLKIGNRMPRLDRKTVWGSPFTGNTGAVYGRYVSNSASIHHFEFREKDLESEDNLWRLYEKWLGHHKLSRSAEEKQKRFKTFKNRALWVQKTNNKNLSYKVGLGQFSDTTLQELRNTYCLNRGA